MKRSSRSDYLKAAYDDVNSRVQVRTRVVLTYVTVSMIAIGIAINSTSHAIAAIVFLLSPIMAHFCSYHEHWIIIRTAYIRLVSLWPEDTVDVWPFHLFRTDEVERIGSSRSWTVMGVFFFLWLVALIVVLLSVGFFQNLVKEHMPPPAFALLAGVGSFFWTLIIMIRIRRYRNKHLGLQDRELEDSFRKALTLNDENAALRSRVLEKMSRELGNLRED